jgi:hypothetical protein
MEVQNRSAGSLVYSLEELHVRRFFSPYEKKQIEETEINTLFQTKGGRNIIMNQLLIQDKEFVATLFDAPPEYFWDDQKILEVLKADDMDTFLDALDFAPSGVIDLIKDLAWRLPISDFRKIEAIKSQLGFDVTRAIDIMKPPKMRIVDPETLEERYIDAPVVDNTPKRRKPIA